MLKCQKCTISIETKPNMEYLINKYFINSKKKRKGKEKNMILCQITGQTVVVYASRATNLNECIQ